MQIYFAELVGSTYEQSWAQNAEGSPEPFDKVRLGSHFFVLSGPEAICFIWEAPSHSIIVWLGSRFLVLSQIPFPSRSSSVRLLHGLSTLACFNRTSVALPGAWLNKDHMF